MWLSKSKWCVSVQAMLKRAGQIGVVSEEQEKHLWMNLGRRKWRSREPLDDVLTPEHPSFLARSIRTTSGEQHSSLQLMFLDVSLCCRGTLKSSQDFRSGYLMASGPSINLIGEGGVPGVIPFRQDVG